MSGLNKVQLIGRLGSNPELREIPNTSTKCVTVSLAINEKRKNHSTKQWENKVEWVRVTFYDKKAETVAAYLMKGSQIYVEGRLKTARDNEGKYYTTVIAKELKFLSRSKSDPANTYPPDFMPDSEYDHHDGRDDIPF